jgi:hypothetical protein
MMVLSACRTRLRRIAQAAAISGSLFNTVVKIHRIEAAGYDHCIIHLTLWQQMSGSEP